MDYKSFYLIYPKRKSLKEKSKTVTKEVRFPLLSMRMT